MGGPGTVRDRYPSGWLKEQPVEPVSASQGTPSKEDGTFCGGIDELVLWRRICVGPGSWLHGKLPHRLQQGCHDVDGLQ